MPVIDRDSCVHFQTGECGLCAEVCQAGAIDYDQPEETLELEVGGVVLTPGFEAFDATRRGEFGFGFARNVLTNVQFERMLSASGPTGGHILRPSDGKPPKRLAFIQCVGSRDSGCDNDYCSSVCCMAATKEAILAKEHEPELDVTIFFLDLRAFGKDFDRYCERAKNQLGVRYVRSFISRTYEMPGTRNLRLVYVDERDEAGRGRVRHGGPLARAGAERVAARAGRAAGRRAEPLGIRRDQRAASAGHVAAGSLRRRRVPGAEGHSRHGDAGQRGRRPGDGAAGPGPGHPRADQDLPAGARHHRRAAADRRVRLPLRQQHRLGGRRRAGRRADAASCPTSSSPSTTSTPAPTTARTRSRTKIAEHRLNRVVVASCTPRTHEPIFRDTLRDAGLEPLPAGDGQHPRPVLVGPLRAIREQATEKAIDLVRMAVGRAARLMPLHGGDRAGEQRRAGRRRRDRRHDRGAGPGRPGLSRSTWSRRQANWAARSASIHRTLDGDDVQAFLAETIERVDAHPQITVHLDSARREGGRPRRRFHLRRSATETGTRTERRARRGRRGHRRHRAASRTATATAETSGSSRSSSCRTAWAADDLEPARRTPPW